MKGRAIWKSIAIDLGTVLYRIIKVQRLLPNACLLKIMQNSV